MTPSPFPGASGLGVCSSVSGTLVFFGRPWERLTPPSGSASPGGFLLPGTPRAGICASDSTWDRPHPQRFDSVGLGWDLDIHVFKSYRCFRYTSWDDNPWFRYHWDQ